jgi:hypothetical protein
MHWLSFASIAATVAVVWVSVILVFAYFLAVILAGLYSVVTAKQRAELVKVGGGLRLRVCV